MDNTNKQPTERQLMLGDMLNNFCTSVIDNVKVDKSAINLLFDDEDISAYELYCLIDIQSVVYEIKGHYDIGLFVNTGLSRGSLGILDEVTISAIEHTVNDNLTDTINLTVIENLIKNNLLSVAYLDSDKLSNTLNVLKAGIIIAFPEIQDCLNDDWFVAFNLVKAHNIHQ